MRNLLAILMVLLGIFFVSLIALLSMSLGFLIILDTFSEPHESPFLIPEKYIGFLFFLFFYCAGLIQWIVTLPTRLLLGRLRASRNSFISLVAKNFINGMMVTAYIVTGISILVSLAILFV